MAAYRVLVVEDNHEVGRMVTASIKTLGAEIDVLEVPSAEEALLISSSVPLDLVVLDIRLPGMSGLEMVTKLQKRKPETKIILVTGVENAAIRQQVSEADVEAFFFKPIEITAFLNAVKRSLWSASSQSSLPSAGRDRVAAIPPTNAGVNGAPSASGAPDIDLVKKPVRRELMPTLVERLTDLKQQVKAVSALLVNDAGQVLEEAGSAVEITTGSALLLALMQAFSASLQVSQAMAEGTSESLQYFVAPRQCMYVSPVGLKHALFVVTSGYFNPDKLGMIDHAIHLAVHDLQAILANKAADEEADQEESGKHQTELPAETTVDQETLAGVENMFSKASKTGGEEQADGFWETLGEDDTLEEAHDKDILSYDQARDMGLAPDEDKQR
jgi:DNA-binding response OmpR family regulator